MSPVSVLACLLAPAFCWGGWGRVARGVTVEGVKVGGLPYAQAEEEIRSTLPHPPFVVHAPNGDLVVPADELTEKDDAAALVRRAKRGESLSLTRSRNWADAEGVLLALCERNAVPARNAELRFSAEGFRYLPGADGAACDYHALLEDVTRALACGESEAELHVFSYRPEVTVETLKERTRPLSSRRTRFDGSNLPRRHNIALAAARISGTELRPGEEFSFNGRVGARTEENGFEVAAVISGGEFVPGVGGGVCQASTTLYLAALEAGMTVTEARAHSLSVGYVPPSLDAMVSSASDLRFCNPYAFSVYILAETDEDGVAFSFYGMPDGRRYVTESVVLARIAPPPPEEVGSGEEGTLRAAKDGIVSESYLLVYDGETLLSRTRLRRDRYACVRGKIGVKKASPLPEGEAGTPEQTVTPGSRGRLPRAY